MILKMKCPSINGSASFDRAIVHAAFTANGEKFLSMLVQVRVARALLGLRCGM